MYTREIRRILSKVLVKDVIDIIVRYYLEDILDVTLKPIKWEMNIHDVRMFKKFAIRNCKHLEYNCGCRRTINYLHPMI